VMAKRFFFQLTSFHMFMTDLLRLAVIFSKLPLRSLCAIGLKGKN